MVLAEFLLTWNKNKIIVSLLKENLTTSPSSRGQNSGGALWRAVYTPGDPRPSWVYSTTLVQYCTCIQAAIYPIINQCCLTSC
jgi:hypothetical protein